MPRNENEKDFYIKIDEIDFGEQDFYIEKNSESSFGQDYYIKLDEGNIVESSKSSNQLDIMNDNNEINNKDIPHYNSPEYAEYISKINKDSLKEISMESVNNDNIALKIKDEAKKKYSKKQIQIFIFALISILFIASIITVGFMFKSVSSSGSTPDTFIGSSSKVLEEFDFLTKVVVASGENSISNYDKLKELAVSKNNIDSDIYNIKIEEVKKLSQKDLDEVNTLKDYITIENYVDIVDVLKLRYENIIELCNKMIISTSSNVISVYNNYAKVEIEIIDILNREFMNKLDQFNISYEFKDGSIILNDENN